MVLSHSVILAHPAMGVGLDEGVGASAGLFLPYFLFDLRHRPHPLRLNPTTRNPFTVKAFSQLSGTTMTLLPRHRVLTLLLFSLHLLLIAGTQCLLLPLIPMALWEKKSP